MQHTQQGCNLVETNNLLCDLTVTINCIPPGAGFFAMNTPVYFASNHISGLTLLSIFDVILN